MEADRGTNYWVDFPAANPNPVLRCNPAGEIVFVNAATRSLCTKLTCVNAVELLPDDHLAHVRRCAVSGAAIRVKSRLKRRVFSWSYRDSSLNGLINIYGHEVTEYFTPGDESFDATISLAAINVLGLPVTVVDGQLNVLFCSEAAKTIIASAVSLSIEDGVLRCQYAKATAQLRAGAVNGGNSDRMLRLPYTHDGTEVELAMLPLSVDCCSTPAVVVHLRVHPGPFEAWLEDGLMRRYGLTEAEARLTNGLVQGWTLTKCAASFGIATSTARTQLKGIFRKTATRRQSELIIKILTAVAW